MKLSSLKTDPEKVKSGVWIGDIPDFGNVRLKVRPLGNPDYRSLYSKLAAAVPRNQKRGGTITDEKVKADLAARCLADTILVDWDGFENDDGSPLVYDAAVAKQMLLDPEMGAFRDAVSWAAGVAEEEARVGFDEKSGNSQPSSVGSSTGATS